MTSTGGLRLSEAVPLAHVVALEVARKTNVRALAIKGPVARIQSLSPDRESVDVDILVDQAGLPRLLSRLQSLGWQDLLDYEFATVIPHHSVSLRHESWPCEIDLHHWFPGFLAHPTQVFDFLWGRRVEVKVAGVSLPAIDAVSHAALLALNYMRDRTEESDPDRVTYLEQVARSWSVEQLDDLAAVAQATGAAGSLRPFFAAAGLAAPLETQQLVISPEAWALQRELGNKPVLPWLIELQARSWMSKPGYVARALLRGDQATIAADLSVPGARRAVLRAKFSRIGRALRSLRQSRADLKKAAEGVRASQGHR